MVVQGACSIDGCDKQATARGWCPKHWWRWRHTGSPDTPTVQDLSTEERFWAKVDRAGTCWFWLSATDRDGYGVFQIKNRQVRAHRFSYALAKGEIPPGNGMVVVHSCDNPPCVNPAHLRLATNAENCADAASKGRRNPGSKNHNAKLTEELVLEMRARYAAGGITYAQLAAEHQISSALVSHIITRKAWRHI